MKTKKKFCNRHDRQCVQLGNLSRTLHHTPPTFLINRG